MTGRMNIYVEKHPIKSTPHSDNHKHWVKFGEIGPFKLDDGAWVVPGNGLEGRYYVVKSTNAFLV